MWIRAAVRTDAAELAELHLQVWDEAYSGLIDQRLLDGRRARPAEVRIARWADRIATTPTLVASDGTRLVGFTTAGPGRDPDPGLPSLELMAIYVLADVYGLGYGHALLEAAVGDAAAYLWVFHGNARAEAFYRRHGFEYDGAERADPYGLERRMRRTQPIG